MENFFCTSYLCVPISNVITPRVKMRTEIMDFREYRITFYKQNRLSWDFTQTLLSLYVVNYIAHCR